MHWNSVLSWPDGEVYGGEDLSLVERCQAGDETAFAALYHHYASYIYRLTFSVLQHREDAEEVLQDTFEYAFRRIDRYDAQKASFKTWLYQIAVSRCRNKRRRKWLPTFPLSGLGEGEARDEQTPLPEELLALNNRQKQIWQALNSLSPKLREAAVLRYYEGLTYPEIGQVLDIPPKTAESRTRLAHNALKEILIKQSSEGD